MSLIWPLGTTFTGSWIRIERCFKQKCRLQNAGYFVSDPIYQCPASLVLIYQQSSYMFTQTWFHVLYKALLLVCFIQKYCMKLCSIYTNWWNKSFLSWILYQHHTPMEGLLRACTLQDRLFGSWDYFKKMWTFIKKITLSELEYFSITTFTNTWPGLNLEFLRKLATVRYDLNDRWHPCSFVVNRHQMYDTLFELGLN